MHNDTKATRHYNWPLSRNQWTRQNIRNEYRLARDLLYQAAKDRNAFLAKDLDYIVSQMELFLTKEQFSLERDDFSEVSEGIFKQVLEKVKKQEAI